MKSRVKNETDLPKSEYQCLVSLIVKGMSFIGLFDRFVGHAVLVFEGIKRDESTRLFPWLWACEFLALYGAACPDFETGTSFLTSTPGIVRTTHPIPGNVTYRNKRSCYKPAELAIPEEELKEGHIVVRHWYITSVKFNEIKKAIHEEEIDPPSYQLAGIFSENTGSLGHNCYTWCLDKLIKLGIKFEPSWLEKMFVSIPALEAKNLSKFTTPTENKPTVLFPYEDKQSSPELRLIRSACIGDYKFLQQAIDDGADVNCTPGFGHPHAYRTALMIAALFGHIKIVNLLIRIPRVNPYIKHVITGGTALDNAIAAGFQDIAIILRRATMITPKKTISGKATSEGKLGLPIKEERLVERLSVLTAHRDDTIRKLQDGRHHGKLEKDLDDTLKQVSEIENTLNGGISLTAASGSNMSSSSSSSSGFLSSSTSRYSPRLTGSPASASSSSCSSSISAEKRVFCC